jgi:hypothetical protein
VPTISTKYLYFDPVANNKPIFEGNINHKC